MLSPVVFPPQFLITEFSPSQYNTVIQDEKRSGWEFPEGTCAGNKGHPSDPETEILKGATNPVGADKTQV